MSAWIVSKQHIDALVQSMIEHDVIAPFKADEIGLALWVENHRSIEARYGDPVPELEYRFQGIEAPLHPVKMLKVSGCYEYQTCEHQGWDDPANPMRLCVGVLERRLALAAGIADPVDAHMEPEYADAPWGVESLDQLVDEQAMGVRTS